tara:strand:- start:245 stop:628 length:384 start_codon:yes stop_codon:yes gene_type:complete
MQMIIKDADNKSMLTMDIDFFADDRRNEQIIIKIYELVSGILSGEDEYFNQYIEGRKVSNLSRITDAVLFRFAENSDFMWSACFIVVSEIARRYAEAVAGQDILWTSEDNSEQYGEVIDDDFFKKYR